MTGSKIILKLQNVAKKKYWNAPTQSLHRFQPSDMLWEAIVAKPTPWLTCAIGSDLFSTPMPAHVLLVPRHCSTNPLTISESFCMGGCGHQLMN